MNKNKWLAIIILITPIVVLGLSTLTFYFGYKPGTASNNGELIYPHIETEDAKLVRTNGELFSFLKGKWYLIYFDDMTDMSESEQKLKFLFSLNTTLGREMNRVKRVVIISENETIGDYQDLIDSFPSTFFVFDKENILKDKITNTRTDPYQSKSIYLSDDFSNIMEEFNSEMEFKEIFEDLKTLL